MSGGGTALCFPLPPWSLNHLSEDEKKPVHRAVIAGVPSSATPAAVGHPEITLSTPHISTPPRM